MVRDPIVTLVEEGAFFNRKGAETQSSFDASSTLKEY